jgi:hypothetical protein
MPQTSDAGGEQVRVLDQRGQGEVAAVGAPHTRDPLRIATPVVTRCSTHAATSSMAPKRFSRSSATRKARPNPDDPRTFGREHRDARGDERLEQRVVDRPLLRLGPPWR